MELDHTDYEDDLQYQLFVDELVAGTWMVHVDAAGNQRRVVPYSEEYWQAKETAGQQRPVTIENAKGDTNKNK